MSFNLKNSQILSDWDQYLRVSVSLSDFTLRIVPVGFQGLTGEVHSIHRFDSRKSELSTGLVLYRYRNRIDCIENVLYRTVRLSIRKMCDVKFDIRKVG